MPDLEPVVTPMSPITTSTITVFTRHSEECPKRDNPQWKRCNCRKHLYIYEAGSVTYRSAKTRSWEQAERLGQAERDLRDPVQIELRKIAQKEEAKQQAAALQDTPLEDALNQWIAGMKDQTDTSIEAYRSTTRRILRWARSKHLVTLRDITPVLLDQWRSEWSPVAEKKENRLTLTTQAALLTRLKGFLRWATGLGLLTRNPGSTLKAITPNECQTMPLTMPQFEEVLAATEKLDTEVRYESARVGRHLKVLFLVQRWTGLRIGDALQLPKVALMGNRIALTMQKTGGDIGCILPDFVVEALNSLPPMKHISPDYFFVSGKAQPKTDTNKWVRKVKRINKYVSLTDDKGEPMEFRSHMLRDTFAVEMLLAGVPLEKVSKLLGHKSIAVTQRYYAKWVASRLRQLEGDVVDAMRRMGVTVTV